MDPCRIILLIENMSFPRDRRVRQEAAALADAGWHVSVVCPRGKTPDSSSFEVINGVKVHRYWQPWQGNGVFGYLLEYGWAILLSLALIVWIWISDDFDVLHAANPPDLFFLVAAPFMLFGKKFVYDQHDLCPELLEFKFGKTRVLKRILEFLESCSYKLADLVIVTNRSAYDIALKRGGVPPGKLCIVRNGPDLESFGNITRPPDRKGKKDYQVLYVGAIANQDGVDRVVRAAHHIVHERGRTDVKFAVVGDGDGLKELQDLAHSLDVEPYIYFAGWVGDTELFSYLSAADVCVAPDPPVPINELSTFIKIMEYMSYGKVTVSFDLLESRRTAGPAAVYVKRDDPALFGDAILQVLDDPGRCERLGRVAIERIRTSLHWGMSRDLLVEAYEQVIRKEVQLSCPSKPEPAADLEEITTDVYRERSGSPVND
jgi:glycosyltransferase involved in cell wall biosynthesis